MRELNKAGLNLKNLRGFLGVIKYCKKLMPDMSGKQIPLIKLLKKVLKCIGRTRKCFYWIKENFANNLKVYDKPFISITNESWIS